MAIEVANAHVLLFPFPAQGHVRPMLNLANLLSTAGDLYITFVNTEHIHSRLVRSASPTAVDRPKFRFRTVPDGIPCDDPRSLLHFWSSIGESMRTRCRGYYRELLGGGGQEEEEEEQAGWPPVTCVVADSSLLLAFEVAEESNIPVILVAPNGPGSMLAHLCIPELMRRGELPFPENADMDEAVQGIAGMEGVLRRKDLPSSMTEAKSIDDPHIQFRMAVNHNLVRAQALILNTSESIDSLVLRHIRSFCPVVYSPGPFNSLLKSRNPDNDTLSASLFQEDRSCIAWLESQPKNSVVYVSFGSITVISRDTFLEFRNGLADTGKRFLWVIRPDMVEGGLESNEKTIANGKGYFVPWAPQEEVLAHPAVGCFLTHCGWNSTLEGIVAGVPMICWPFFTDQPINSRLVSQVYRIGVDMNGLCRRGVVERMVRQLMDGERAEEMKRRASEMAEMVRRSTEEGGSSYNNFRKLIEHIKSLS